MWIDLHFLATRCHFVKIRLLIGSTPVERCKGQLCGNLRTVRGNGAQGSSSGKCRKKAKISRGGGGEAGGVGGGGQIEREEKQEEVEEKDR